VSRLGVVDPPTPRPMKVSEFESLVGILRMLERKGPVTVALRGGSMALATGSTGKHLLLEQ
jgi:hypothetical protein